MDRIAWLTTLRADGSPHTTPVWLIEDGSVFWLTTGDTVKARNIARDPRVSLAIERDGSRRVAEGAVTVESIAEHRDVAAAFIAEYGWDPGSLPDQVFLRLEALAKVR